MSRVRPDDTSGWSEGVVPFKGPTQLIEELPIEFRLRRGVVILLDRSVRSDRGRRTRISEEGP